MHPICALLLLVAVATAVAAGDFDLHTKLGAPRSTTNTCSADNNITTNQLGVLKQAAQIVARTDFKCYVRCLTEVMGIFNANGHLDIDRLVELRVQLHDDGAAVRATAARCVVAMPSAVTDCEDTYAMFRCLYSK